MRMTGLYGIERMRMRVNDQTNEWRMDTRLPKVERRDAEEARESGHPGHHLVLLQCGLYPINLLLK